MKGVRFYEEFSNKRRGKSEGKVLAVDIEWFYGESGYLHEAIGALFFHPNSAVGGTSVSPEYLRDSCKRISEAKARQIHPNLFEWLNES